MNHDEEFEAMVHCRALFRYAMGDRKASAPYNHQSLNCRYGIEIEFFSSANRFVIGHRVNNCIWNQNNTWWRNNFDALSNLTGIPRPNPITSGTSMNEWSSFMLEIMKGYHDSTHRGDERCGNRGNGSAKIENDSSVTVNNDTNDATGVTIFSISGPQFTEIAEQTGGKPLKGYVKGLNNCDIKPSSASPLITTHFTLIEGRSFNVDGDPGTVLDPWEQNELVSGILANVHIDYPNRLPETTTTIRVPYGSIVIDNLFNHMLSHQNALFIQRCGFHVHLTEYPRIDNQDKRARMMGGFVKLFWLFEPLLFSFQPYYRTRSSYTQSIQSMFNFSEITTSNMLTIWNELIYGGTGFGGRRIAPGLKFLSLNMANFNTIGTAEVRLGHGTFDSRYVQAYINVLQNLFMFNVYLCKTQEDQIESGAITLAEYYDQHNGILAFSDRQGAVPPQCKRSSATYNQVGGGPVNGFFQYGTNTSRTTIVSQLYKLFYLLTSAKDSLTILHRYLQEYHTYNNSWVSRITLDAFLINPIFDEINAIVAEDGFNAFKLIIMPINYRISSNQSDLDDDCKTCSKDSYGNCGSDFNRGNLPTNSTSARTKDEAYVYRQTCGSDNDYFKTQTELLNHKIRAGYRGGYRVTRGRKGSKSNPRISNKKMTRRQRRQRTVSQHGGVIMNTIQSIPPTETTNSEYVWSGRVNEGADRIFVQDVDGILTAFRGNWMGEKTADETLSAIFNALLERSVLTREQLDLLIEKGYSDLHVFTLRNSSFERRLVNELKALNISEDKINEIRNVYKPLVENADKKRADMLASLKSPFS